MSQHGAVLEFTDLGFSPLYSIDVDPPFPGDGDWGAREIRVHRDADLVIRVRPSTGEPWVAFFATERRGLHVGVHGCPNPDHLLVCNGLEAYLIDTNDPESMTTLGVVPTTGVIRPTNAAVVAVASFTSIAAVDVDGLHWRTARLFLDDCEFDGGSDDDIRVRGSVSYPRDDRTLTLDADTGEVIAGDWSPDQVPGQDSMPWHRGT